MTLCIAALCRKTDENDDEGAVAICADQKMQTGIAGANLGFKIARLGDRWSALMAGEWAVVMEAVPLFKEVVAKSESTDDNRPLQSATSIIDDFQGPLFTLQTKMQDRYIRRTFSMPLEDFLAGGKDRYPAETVSQAFYELTRDCWVTGEHLQLIIIGWFMDRFHLYKITGTRVEEYEPFAAIGQGQDVAEPWLFYRECHDYNPGLRVLYYLYEAHSLARIVPSVGDAQFGFWSYNPHSERLEFTGLSTIGQAHFKQVQDGVGPKAAPVAFEMPPNGLFLVEDTVAKEREERKAAQGQPPSSG